MHSTSPESPLQPSPSRLGRFPLRSHWLELSHMIMSQPALAKRMKLLQMANQGLPLKHMEDN